MQKYKGCWGWIGIIAAKQGFFKFALFRRSISITRKEYTVRPANTPPCPGGDIRIGFIDNIVIGCFLLIKPDFKAHAVRVIIGNIGGSFGIK